MNIVYKDFLGNPIEEGMKAVRVHSYSNWKEFQKCVVEKIQPGRSNGYAETPIGIISEGNERIGWTFPERIIVETGFKEKL